MVANFESRLSLFGPGSWFGPFGVRFVRIFIIRRKLIIRKFEFFNLFFVFLFELSFLLSWFIPSRLKTYSSLGLENLNTICFVIFAENIAIMRVFPFSLIVHLLPILDIFLLNSTPHMEIHLTTLEVTLEKHALLRPIFANMAKKAFSVLI